MMPSPQIISNIFSFQPLRMALQILLNELSMTRAVNVQVLPIQTDVVAEALTYLPAKTRVLAESFSGSRQSQFVFGRLAVAQALVELNQPVTEVLPNSHGAPQFPNGVLGSISHTEEYVVAVCALSALLCANRGQCHALGVDIQAVNFARPVNRGIRSKISAEADEYSIDDLHVLSDYSDVDREQLALLRLFCVKESAYKALHVALSKFNQVPDVRFLKQLKCRLYDIQIHAPIDSNNNRTLLIGRFDAVLMDSHNQSLPSCQGAWALLIHPMLKQPQLLSVACAQS